MVKRAAVPLAIIAVYAILRLLVAGNLLNSYLQLILMYIGINSILALSLNVVNGYLGEFSVGHAGFMSAGAYAAAFLTVKVLPGADPLWAFPMAVLVGGAVAGLLGLAIAIPSFKTRGDYLAIVTLAFVMMVKSGLENIGAVGGAKGFMGMNRYTSLPVVFLWTAGCVWCVKNLVNSAYGREIQAIREDETAAGILGIDTRRAKIIAFGVSAFWAGIAGGLLAHLLQYINPGMFDIVKSTEILIMVYLGGTASITGSLAGAAVYGC